VDAQAAAESTLMLWATVLSRADVVLHAAGWLEGGLTASFEKFALDVELLEQFATTTRGIGFSDEELAFDALKEVGPGGLWLASEHTMAHFKEWLTMSPLFTTPDIAAWEAMGSPDARQRALERWKALLASYEDPGIDEAIDEELRAFIERRKREPVPDDEE
jgi:trimethylamine--corrinoid protein Co-methyltransferase